MANSNNNSGSFEQTNASIQKTDPVPSFNGAKSTASDRLSQARRTASGTCEFCEKHGLAILPVRPGVMHVNSGAPVLPESFRSTVREGAELPFAGPTQYTVRTVRSGYIYVYDERGWWEWYWVTEHGYLMKLPKPGSPMNSAFTVGREPCDRTGHKEIGSCITVSDPNKAKRIWIAFSGAEWTPRVLQLHQDEAYRKRHMREFDVKAWMTSHKAAHAKTIDAVSSVVAEYAPKTKVDAFAFSPYEFRSRASTVDALLEAAKSCGPAPGAVLMLNDPVGVVTEIAARLAELRHQFMSQGDRDRKLNASTAILNAQELKGRAAQDDVIGISDQLNLESHWQTDGVGRTIYVQSAPKLRDPTESEMLDAAKNSWTKYLGDYDEKARAAWHKQFLVDFDDYSKRTLNPLATAHSVWLKSEQLANHFDATHDETSAEHGLVYARQLVACVQDTQLYQPCLDLHYKWAKGSYSEPNNLLLRGLVLNLKAQRELIAKQLGPDVTWTTVGWDNLCGFFNGLADNALKHNSEVLPQLVLAFGGAITKLLRTAVGDARVPHGLVALGTVTQRPVVPVQLTGTFKAMRASVMRQLLKAPGVKKLSENALQQQVTLALRRLAIQGQPMNKSVSVSMLVMIDQETLHSMPKGLSKAKQAQWVASSLHTVEEVEALNIAARQQLMADIPAVAGAAKAGTAIARAVPIVGNIVAAYVQIAAIKATEEALGTAAGLAKLEVDARLMGGASLLMSTLSDSLDRLLKALGVSELQQGRGVVLRFFARWAPVGAKVLGVAGAVIGALCDIGAMIRTMLQGNAALGAAYGASALGGGLIAIALITGGLPLLLTGALIYLIAQIAITKLGDDKLDTWLKRCIWGNDAAVRYTDMKQEMSEWPLFPGA
ncbi:T6SS effector BTH_I2691 family protein [Caballeronia sp. AZ10_KS36]|uniref:T6SS effector BTH_I2691 family protein n=1 Tax=Caballeronia sp. AZ10_KS36 TaxID=2921757 RepID=UPI00202811AD